MDMRIPVLLGIICVLFVSGCTQLSEFSDTMRGKTPIKDLSENPNEYLGQEVSIRGEYLQMMKGFETFDVINDDDGYYIIMEGCKTNRAFQLGNNYDVTGKIRVRELCKCQYQISGTENWNNMMLSTMERSECESKMSSGGNLIYRCDPNSIENFYYLEC